MSFTQSKISPCLWFNGNAEEAATFYVSLLPNSRITKVQRSLVDTPGGKAGDVLVVTFELAGQGYLALNGNADFQHSHAISFLIDCEDQAEVDRLWDTIVADGGKPVQCGWISDRFGISWQIIPKALPRLLGDPDRGRAARAMQAMLKMVKIDVAALERAADAA
jgi:predicted 3-demethylubiquinone-9 3-methyltransferase (glyoxalase superfamily)